MFYGYVIWFHITATDNGSLKFADGICHFKRKQFKPFPVYDKALRSVGIIEYEPRGNVVSRAHRHLYIIRQTLYILYTGIFQNFKRNFPIEFFLADSSYIIKALTGAGKSHSYLRLMAENPNDRFLIAAPTNLLKNEIYHKAHKMGIDAAKTPSLDEIKADIPSNIWHKIERLYKSGKHNAVQSYIDDVLSKKNIPCLKKYRAARNKLKTFNGSVITTHRYLLNMDKKRLDEYNAIIIDEDIIFKSIISNQGEITISDLEKLLGETTDSQLAKKIKRLLKAAKTQSCIEMEGFENDGSDKISMVFDIPSFCLAEKFYVRRSSKERNLEEDTVTFLKPANFEAEKYIMVSATADEEICNKYFGEENVEFYECKKAEYKGVLKQYPEKSMSRTCVANNCGIVRNLMKHFRLSEGRVITFMRENIGNLHFGNTEGSNTLEGKDILVVGTPYHAEFLYKLSAFFMGLNFDEDEEVSSQIVEHNGYRFTFTTFKNEGLRSIQFWMLESELEQAVGRARLLRNECTVNLFSNFPLSQSQMVSGFNYDDVSNTTETSG